MDIKSTLLTQYKASLDEILNLVMLYDINPVDSYNELIKHIEEFRDRYLKMIKK